MSEIEDYVECGDGRGSPEKEVGGGEGVMVGGHFSTDEGVISTPGSSTEDKWQNEEAKEQFSPVCVLDFPSTDEEEVSSHEEVSSPFQSRLDCVEGRKKKLMQTVRRFEGIAKLEPINLSKKFSLSEQADESIDGNEKEILVQDGDDVAHSKALDLLGQIKTAFKNYKYDYKTILFDFFRECVSEKNGIRFENELILEVRDWINGNPREMYLGWEEAKNRIPYMRDIEKGGKWNIRVLAEHKEEFAFELEGEVLAQLVDELVLDLI